MTRPGLFLLFALAMLAPAAPVPAQGVPAATIITPTPKWQYAGCFSSWCQTGWYSSPAVADLDGDGDAEVIWSAYKIDVVDGATGAPLWTVRSGHDRSYTGSSDVGRTWPGIAVADIDGDGPLELVTAHSGGWVGVYDGNGSFKPGWPRQPFTAEIRSLAVADLDGDGRMEIVVARASGGSGVWTVLQFDGTTRPGWPQIAPGGTGYAAGAYNQNIAIADIDGDGRGEIIGPSDVHYISAFNDDGSQIGANARYNASNPRGPKVWSQVGVHVDDAVDLRGYANCGVEHRPNWADSAPVIADMDGNGALEVIAVGNVYNCGTSPYSSLRQLPFIFHPDRSRWAAGSFDWTAIPPLSSTGAPLSEDYNVIQSALPNPVVADLDGDGVREILYASYDGTLHAFWMDKTQRGSWPLDVTALAGEWSFASEPVVVDVDNDGKAEVILGTWPRNGGRRVGRIIVADWQGNVLQQFALPAPRSSDANAWNGALAAPTLANIDTDADLELVVGTVGSGMVAYDLPGTANARVLWGTGRGSFLRTGAAPPNPLRATYTALGALPQPGDVITMRLELNNVGGASLAAMQFSTTLPAGLSYDGGLVASHGMAGVSGQTVTWNGTVVAGQTVTLTFRARIDAGLATPVVLFINGRLEGGYTADLRAMVIVGARVVWLPLVRRT
ncbi:MAG: VCBS repeat-containing protein [Chloroflexi bacterium]|nr:VCBS repeat-containing protein [Chloroflexota bacterium]